MTCWEKTFQRLDGFSRTRALTWSESMLLELAIRKIDRAAQRKANGDKRRARA